MATRLQLNEIRVYLMMAHKLSVKEIEQRANALWPNASALQIAVLRHLEVQPRTMSELSTRLLTTTSTLVAVVDKLETEGLIERSVDPNDRRRTPLTLTAKGRDALARIRPDDFDLLNNALEKMGEAQAAELHALLSQLVHGLQPDDTMSERVLENARQRAALQTRNAIQSEWVQRKWLNVPYARQSAAQQLDVYLPAEGAGPFPLIIAIHGGAFMSGDKASGEMTPMLEGLKRGYAVASINYRLSGEALFPAQIQDVKAATRFMRAHAKKYRVDPERFAAWGPSAGGHLSALAGTSGSARELEDLRQGNSKHSSRVQAIVDWYGPINFLTMDPQNTKSGLAQRVPGVMVHSVADSPESKLLGRHIEKTPERVRAANPETYISRDTPPFLIQHGTLDPLIPMQQSIEFAAALNRAIGKRKVQLDLLEGAGHGGPQFTTPKNLTRVLDFLDKHLK